MNRRPSSPNALQRVPHHVDGQHRHVGIGDGSHAIALIHQPHRRRRRHDFQPPVALVYWWGGQQAARGGALYAPGARYSFTYPPFAAALFGLAAHAPEGVLAVVITAASAGVLAALCALSLGVAGVRRRPEMVFAVTALALLTWPVAYTLRLGEVNLIVAALAGADLLRRHDGHRGQGIATGLAAGIKLTPLIFVAYLLITGRVRAAATAAAAFAATVAIGVVLLPAPSRAFWLDGVFFDQNRIGDPANPSDQSLSGAVALLAGSLDPAYRWWAIAALLTGLAGITVAAWAHRRGRRLTGVTCCAITGLLISPFSWTHHWVWAVPLLAAPGRYRVPAALSRLRPGRSGGRRGLLQAHPALLARSSA